MRRLAVVLLLLLGACSDDGDDDEPAADEPSYALLDADGWQLQEAVDPPADDRFASLERPPVEWYAEYTVPDHTRMIRLSGHAATFAGTRTALEAGGFDFHDVDVPGWTAAGSAPGNTFPALVVLDAGESSLMLLSYELTLDELVAAAAEVEAVDADAWVGAGGVIRPSS